MFRRDAVQSSGHARANAAHSGRAALPSVLFLCTGNSCRSQMAEGWASALHGDRLVAMSAGTAPQPLNPLAVAAMFEVGIDISGQASKSIAELSADQETINVVITVCDSARESCPVFSGVAKVMHRSFDDPPRLAAAAQTQEEALPHYRRVRDEIRGFVAELPSLLTRNAQIKSKEPLMSETTAHSCCAPDCCGEAASVKMPSPDPFADMREKVRSGYAAIARTGQWSGVQATPIAPSDAASKPSCCAPSNGGGGCCGGSTVTADHIAAAIGYAREELSELPEGANLGLSCGNPNALAALRPGEVVLDLGAGGGFDCFIAGPKVGASGKVIGVDMTPDMVTRARGNLAAYRERSGLDNIEFRLGDIENLPVPDGSVDVVISNCVLNLSPDKPRVWREIARVLKPGGRVAVSDLALLMTLPSEVKADVEALVGCIAGAVMIGLTERMARDAGLTDIRSQRKPGYVDAMVSNDDPLYRSVMAKLPAGSRVGDYVASVDFTATRPDTTESRV